MDLIKKINSQEVRSKTQIERRRMLKDKILQRSQSRIGLSVICFENEGIESDQTFMYKRAFIPYKTIPKKVPLTIGKFYTILEIKKDEIKVKNDLGKKVWYTIKRFLYTIKYERCEKLKNIIQNV